MTDRRFIEETFPVKEVSAESAHEKNIRHGHISTLHIWWARRPLAASRATAYAALVPASDDPVKREKRRQFIAELCKWENSLDPHLLERARRDILEAHAERLSKERGETVTAEDIEAGRAPRPRVLDPFAGGGAIPLEALRLGCEVYASDYNPVAVLILKATLEYPEKYGRPFEGMPEHLLRIRKKKPGKSSGGGNVQIAMELGAGDGEEAEGDPDFNPLLEAVKYWGDWVLEEARKELADFYPPDADGSFPVGFIWARTIPCQNPTCERSIPLMLQFWLDKKARTKGAGRIALRPRVVGEEVDFEIEEIPAGWKCKRRNCDCRVCRGTISNAVATCPACGTVIDGKTIRRLFEGRRTGEKLVAVVTTHPDQTGKSFRRVTEGDLEIIERAYLEAKARREHLAAAWGIDPVPFEPIPDKRPSPNARGASGLTRYAISSWGDLYSPRQQLALMTFAEKIRAAHMQMVSEGISEDFATAVVVYLAFAVDKLATYQNRLTRWNVSSTSFAGKPDQAPTLAMKWDYAESNPFSGVTGSFTNQLSSILTTLDRLTDTSRVSSAYATQGSAIYLSFGNDDFDAVLTDPPYYDNVPYSQLSDFFYVLLKRQVGHLFPDLFSTPLTPKTSEIVAYSQDVGGFAAGKDIFEKRLQESFEEIHRVLSPSSVAIVVYAHKSTEGWETVINALLDSGLVATAAWPISTERRGRRQAHETAALSSSIYIAVRKIERQAIGLYHEVRDQMRKHISEKLDRLWAEGIGGADFFIAAIGSAIEVFGRYEKVIDYEGNVVRAERLLEDVRTMATDFAVRRILRDGFVEEVSDLTRFYVLWRWNFGEARAPFDEARKLAQSCGLDLTQEWNRAGSFVRKQKEYVRVLGPGSRDLKQLVESHELIDALHLALRLWEKGQRGEMVQAMAASGFGMREVLYRVAQAVAESLPKESKEKRLLEGFLAGRERVQAEVGKVLQQDKLFD